MVCAYFFFSFFVLHEFQNAFESNYLVTETPHKTKCKHNTVHRRTMVHRAKILCVVKTRNIGLVCRCYVVEF